jgi:hypothetical protein
MWPDSCYVPSNHGNVNTADDFESLTTRCALRRRPVQGIDDDAKLVFAT